MQAPFTPPPGPPLPWGVASRLPYRGWASRVFSPFETELAGLGDVYPFAFVLFDTARNTSTGSLGSLQAARGYTSQPEGCWLTHLVGSATLVGGGAGSVVVQLYDTLRQLLLTPQPITLGNVLGTAQEPMWLKHLYKLPANAQLQSRVTNLTTTATNVQIVAWGVRPRRKGKGSQ